MIASLKIVVVGVALIVLESLALVLMGMESFALQAGLAVVIYLGLQRDLVRGAWGCIVLVLVLELFTAGPPGLYAVGGVAVFLIFHLGRRLLQSGSVLTNMLAGAIAALVHGLTMMLVALFSVPDSNVPAAILWQLPVAVLGLAIGVPIVFGLLSYIDAPGGNRTLGYSEV